MPRHPKSHLSRANKRKRTSVDFEGKKKGAQISKFSREEYVPCPSGYTRSQGWGLLYKAWIGYKIALNKETFWDRLNWAQVIQNIQTDLGITRASFPQLGLLGDVTFLYDKVKELELQTEHDELWMKNYKKKKRQHIKTIVDSSMLSDEEKEWMYDGIIPEYAERLIMI